MINVCFGDIGIEILAFDEAQEEFIHDLNVRPSNLQDGLILLWIKSLALRVHGWGDWSEKILGEHLDNSGIHGLGNDLSVVGHVVEQLVQSQAFDLLGFHVTARVVKVEDDVALVDLLHE